MTSSVTAGEAFMKDVDQEEEFYEMEVDEEEYEEEYEEEEEEEEEEADHDLIGESLIEEIDQIGAHFTSQVAYGATLKDGDQEEAYGEIKAEEQVEVKVEAEEHEDDNQADNGLVGEPLTPVTEEIHQIDDDASMDSAGNEPYINPHFLTPIEFEANAAGKSVSGGEDDSLGKRSPNVQFCKASNEVRINCFEKQDVSGGKMIASVGTRAYLEDVTGQKRLIESVNNKLDATPIAESSTPPELTHCNKRPAIICSFFAKGWCIKGKSCRFLHVRDELASESKESVAIAATHKSEHPLSKDFSLTKDSALDDGEILKQKNEARGLLKGDNEFHGFLGHDTWPVSSSSGQKMSSMSTFWKRDPSLVQKCLDSDPEYQATETSYFQHYSLPSFGSALQDQPRSKQSAKYKTILFGNWEPSTPFRPSHVITQRVLSRGNLYDPLHDSVEQTHMREKVSQRGQDSFGESNNVYAKAHAKCPENDFKNNLISGSNFNSKEIQKDSSKIQSVNAETTVEKQKSSLLTENDSSLNRIQRRGIIGGDMVDINDSELCTDRQSHTTQPNIDCVKQDNGNDFDVKPDDKVPKESKELKIFHAALVEHVKELLTQPWHDGLLSKDVYKLIVKKAVDKVISTMEPHQIPVSSESINQYFSLYNRKLVKLVQAYVDKYGKSLPG